MTQSNLSLISKPSMFFASFFGAGFAPAAPGTSGSILAAIIWRFFVPRAAAIPAAAALGVVGLLIVRRTKNYLDSPDDPRIVIDEAAGTWLALALAPRDIFSWFAAFVFFRFFDIVKPLGIKKIQRLPYEWGIMLDDTAAGFLAGASAWAVEWLRGAVL